MENEARTLDSLKEAFPALDTDQAVTATRRIFLHVPADMFADVLRCAAQEIGYTHLCTITGLDALDHYEFLYHISNSEGILLTLKLRAEKAEPTVIASVLPIYSGATFYERELEGLLGVKVEGLPEGRQYPLPDNWPKSEYPLRKGWIPPAAKDTDKA